MLLLPLNPLLEALNRSLEEFQHIVTYQEILSERHESRLSDMKVRLVLSDSSTLIYAETVLHRLNKRKYSFQWMNADSTLRIRWDNAPHHSHISTFPHHKHVGDENNIQESPEMSLSAVLSLIAATL